MSFKLQIVIFFQTTFQKKVYCSVNLGKPMIPHDDINEYWEIILIQIASYVTTWSTDQMIKMWYIHSTRGSRCWRVQWVADSWNRGSMGWRVQELAGPWELRAQGHVGPVTVGPEAGGYKELRAHGIACSGLSESITGIVDPGSCGGLFVHPPPNSSTSTRTRICIS